MTSGIGQIFSRGLDGLNVNQRGMAVTSNNIANMNSPGYARQEIIIGANQSSGGGGASVLGVNAITSPFIELQMFNTMNSFGYVDGRRRTVAQVEELFNETQNNGLAKSLGDFFGSLNALANDASSITARQVVRDAGQRLSDKFNTLHRQLNQMRTDITTEVAARIETINDYASQIAQLNGQIQGNPNQEQVIDLKSQRLSLLKDLSQEVNISYYEQDNMVQVAIAGSVSFINGVNAGELSMTNDLSLGGTMAVNCQLAGSTSSLDVTAQITGGRLGGNIVERNTTLNDRMDDLDELAYQLITQLNTQHSAGYALDGSTGINFFEPVGAQAGAARNIRLDAAIEGSLRNIAAAGQDPTVSGVSDNTNALAMAGLQNDQTMGGGSQTFLQFYQEVVGTVGTTAKSVQRDYETQQNLLNQLTIQREAVSGVNLDEEGANIIRFQRAFQASSRLIAVADELLKSILEI